MRLASKAPAVSPVHCLVPGSQASPIRPDKHFAHPRESHQCLESPSGHGPPKGPTKWRIIMTPKRSRTGLRVLLLMLVMTPVLLWSMSSSALYRSGPPAPAPETNLAMPLAPAVPMPPPKADLDQVRNGSAEAPISPASWVNGNAG